MNSYRRRLATALIPLALVVTGCGGGDDAAGDRARTVTTPESEEPSAIESGGDTPLTEAQLKSALLTVQDLPTGYTVGESSDDDEIDHSADPEECASKFEALDETEEQDVAAEAEAAFEGGFGVVLEQELESYEDENVLKQKMEDVLEVMTECPTFTDTDESGDKIEFTVSPLSFPKLGDDTIALNIKIKTADFDGTLNLVVVRLGRNVMSVGQGGLTADAAVLEQVTHKGLEKLAAVAR